MSCYIPQDYEPVMSVPPLTVNDRLKDKEKFSEAPGLHSWLARRLKYERAAVLSHLEEGHHELLKHFQRALKAWGPAIVERSSQTNAACEEDVTGQTVKVVEMQAKSSTAFQCKRPYLIALGEPSDTQGIEDDAPRGSAEDFLEVLIEGDSHEVRKHLGFGADPNAIFERFQISGLTFFKGQPLAIAALRGDVDIARTLIDGRAAVDSKYRFIAGKTKSEVVLSASHAAINNANDDLLHMLLSSQADVNSTASLNGTLLWQAAYAGHVATVDVLLRARADLEIAAKSQDDLTQLYTPLHSAALCGHQDVVRKLLDWRSDCSGRNELGATPIFGAIAQGHGEVVRMLVGQGADLLEMFPPSFVASFSSRCNTPEVQLVPLQPLDLLFSYATGAVIAKAALGLGSAPKDAVGGLDTKDLIRFLRTPGPAPKYILEAIMRTHDLRYWDDSGNRVHVNAAEMSTHLRFRIAVGPHMDFLKSSYDTKMKLSRTVTKFIEELAPRPHHEHFRPRGTKFVPGSIHMCLVPNILEDDQVLRALVDCPMPDVFGLMSARIILQGHWMKFKLYIYIYMVIEVVYLAAFCGINISIIGGDSMRLSAFTWIGTCLCLIQSCLSLANAIGYCIVEKGNVLHHDPYSWRTLFFTLGQGTLLSVIHVQREKSKESAVFNFFFAVSVYVMWIQMLLSFRGLRRIGKKILPIMEAMQAVGPFIGVLSIYLLGCFNAYYALNQLSFWESAWMVFGIVFLLDIEWVKLENTSSDMRLLENGKIVPITVPEADRSEYHFITYLFAYFAAFVLGTALMNIFIAVLSECYGRACASAESLLLCARANQVLQAKQVRVAFSFLVKRTCVRRARRLSRSFGLERSPPEMPMNYLWFFSSREDEY